MESTLYIRRWHNGLKLRHIAHSIAGSRYQRLGRRLGVPVVIMTTIVGTTAFASIGAEEASVPLRIFAGILSIIAAILSTLQTFLNYSEAAERHQNAATKYGGLRRKLEEHLTYTAEKDLPKPLVEEIRKDWDDIDSNVPNLPQWAHDRALRKIKPAVPDQEIPRSKISNCDPAEENP